MTTPLEWPSAEEVEKVSVYNYDRMVQCRDTLAALIRALDGQATGMVDALSTSHVEQRSRVIFNEHYDDLYSLARRLEKLLSVARGQERERCAKICLDHPEATAAYLATAIRAQAGGRDGE